MYQFARFNRKAQVITYSDEEFKKVIEPVDKQRQSDWTRLESDVLMDLCERFQLRFIVIADRFSNEVQDHPQNKDKSLYCERSVDEIKDRYFQVAKLLLISRGQISNPIVTKPFNFEHEVRRKTNLEKIFMRTKE